MKALLAFVSLIGLVMPEALAGDRHGEAHCRMQPEMRCHLEWDMSATPRPRYRLERFDVDLRAWLPHVELSRRHWGVGTDELPAASLLRVRGCEDFASPDSCVASVVLWVPFFATSTEDLPDTVAFVNPPVGHIRVHKDNGLYGANLDYNMARIANIMRTIYPEDVTPMTFPPVRVLAGKPPPTAVVMRMTEDMWLHNEVYGTWEQFVEGIVGP